MEYENRVFPGKRIGDDETWRIKRSFHAGWMLAVPVSGLAFSRTAAEAVRHAVRMSEHLGLMDDPRAIY